MEWLEISYQATEENYDKVSQIFIDAGSKGVLLEDSKTPFELPENLFGEIYRLNADDYPTEGVVVKGYLAVVPQVEVLVDVVKEKLFNISPEAAFSFTVTTIAEEDWEHGWKVDYKPIYISESLMIKPSWLGRSNDEGVVEIMLDPGMAFGSGTHATTRLCLQLLEKYIMDDSRVVDVGTGSGVLAIAVSKLGAQLVYGVDLDEMALIRAKENAQLNGCDILIEKSDLMAGVKSLDWRPNLIVANILAQAIVEMLEDVSEALSEGDVFICSGIIDDEQGRVVSALEEHGFKVVEICEENGWVAIAARR